MNVVEEFEEVNILDHGQRFADLDPGPEGSSTQQLLDELLGRFEEDDSHIFLAQGPTPEFYADSDE
jgi:hypothetical protein